jgi:hypothetical protein
MVLYSVVVLGLLMFGFWRDRRNPRFPFSAALAVIAHAIILFLTRTAFPFNTFIAVVPLAILEAPCWRS